EGRAREGLEAWNRRHGRGSECAAGRYQHVGRVAARARLQKPLALALVPARDFDLGASADPVEHPVARRDVFNVGLDLGLGRIAVRPARIGRERELVEMRGYVAGGTGIGVPMPDAAELLAA